MDEHTTQNRSGTKDPATPANEERARPAEHDLIQTIVVDHRAVEALCVALEDARSGDDELGSLTTEFADGLRRHAWGARQHLHPLIRSHLYDSDRLVDQWTREDAELEAALQRLGEPDCTDELAAELRGLLIESFRGHAAAEEQAILPRLRLLCTARELERIGYAYAQLKDAEGSDGADGAGSAP